MKIALIGSASSSVNLAPFKDQRYSQYLGGSPEPKYPPSPYIAEDWEIWGCSPGAWSVIPKADRWFEVHRWEPGQVWFSPEYTQFLQNFRGPVYTGGPIPVIQNATIYPIERIEAEFSAYFLHSSLSLMAALAIMEIEDQRKLRKAMSSVEDGRDYGTDEDDVIGFWGVDMAATEEYGDQRSGCQFFILEALRRGIAVYVPPESCLLRPRPVYGLSEWQHDYIKMTARAREFNQRITNLRNQMNEAQGQLHFMSGAQDDLNYMVNTWTSPYGIPAGVRVRIAPGTGLGGGTTLPRPQNAPVEAFTPTGAQEVQTAQPVDREESIETARRLGKILDAPTKKAKPRRK